MEESRFTTAAARFFSRPRPERIDGISASEKSRESFTVRRASSRSSSSPASALLARDFQWRATSLPEIVLVTPRERREKEGRGVERGHEWYFVRGVGRGPLRKVKREARPC